MRMFISVLGVALSIFFLSSCTRTEKSYYPDGNIQSIITYRAGKEHGKAMYYYDNPNTLEIEIEMQNGKRHGEFFRYFENGALDTHCFYVNDSIDGVQTLYTANGEKTQEITYRNGCKDGPYRAYHLNGDLNIEGNYKDGLYEGVWNYYDERGVLVGEGNFKEGTGTLTSYDAFGHKSKVTPYVRNHKHGKELYFNSAEQVIKEVVYEQDRIVSQTQDTTINS